MADGGTPGVTNNIEDDGRKKLLIIGKTGTGKSSLCNRIGGNNHKDPMFPVSAEASSCTQHTQFAQVFFNKEKDKPLSIIDTIGFDDPDKDDDAKIIAELVDKLKHQCDHINLFVIAVNGQSPRLDGSLLGMIKIFEGMFGTDFWKQVVVVFTRISMDAKTKRKRENNTGQTDDDLAKKYMDEVKKRFKNGKNVEYLFLDACFDETDPDEKESFTTSMDRLYTLFEEAGNLPTSKVREIETQTAALKREIAEKEKQRKEAEDGLHEELNKMAAEKIEAQRKATEANEAYNLKLKEMEEKQQKAATKYENEMSEMQKNSEIKIEKENAETAKIVAKMEEEKEKEKIKYEKDLEKIQKESERKIEKAETEKDKMKAKIKTEKEIEDRKIKQELSELEKDKEIREEKEKAKNEVIEAKTEFAKQIESHKKANQDEKTKMKEEFAKIEKNKNQTENQAQETKREHQEQLEKLRIDFEKSGMSFAKVASKKLQNFKTFMKRFF